MKRKVDALNETVAALHTGKREKEFTSGIRRFANGGVNKPQQTWLGRALE